MRIEPDGSSGSLTDKQRDILCPKYFSLKIPRACNACNYPHIWQSHMWYIISSNTNTIPTSGNQTPCPLCMSVIITDNTTIAAFISWDTYMQLWGKMMHKLQRNICWLMSPMPSVQQMHLGQTKYRCQLSVNKNFIHERKSETLFMLQARI